MSFLSRRSCLLLAVMVTLTSAAPALAHARLLSVEAGQTSAELLVTFSEATELAFSKITLLDGGGVEIPQAELATDPADNRRVRVELQGPLVPGKYQVQWSIVSADGHKIEGTEAYDAVAR